MVRPPPKECWGRPAATRGWEKGLRPLCLRAGQLLGTRARKAHCGPREFWVAAASPVGVGFLPYTVPPS